MDLRVDPTRETSPSRQIVEGVLDAVAAGRMAPGERLPSVRTLAAAALVNPNTAGKAYRDLELLGVLHARVGDGVFVAPEGPAIARAARQAATLDAVRQAAQAALRAGHDQDALLEEIRRALAPAASRSRKAAEGARR